LLAFTTFSNTTEIATMDLSRTNANQITHGEKTWSGICGSSGRYIVFTSHRSSEPSIWRIDANGDNRRLVARNATQPSCSPDGKSVEFTSLAKAKGRFSVPIDGGAVVPVIDQPDGAELSSDGQKVAYSPEGSQETHALVIALTSNRERPIRSLRLPDAKLWHWDPNNQDIDFVKTATSTDNIWRVPSDGGPPVQLTYFDSGEIFDFAWSPDSKKLAIAKGSTSSDVVLIRNSAASH
jgi:Tol biopolymer transport system component